MSEETKYIVARNDWCARRTLKMVLQGKVSETALFPSHAKAEARIRKMREVNQEEYSVFRMKFKR